MIFSSFFVQDDVADAGIKNRAAGKMKQLEEKTTNMHGDLS